MGQIDAALSHHLDEISEAQFEPEIPTHTENNDLPIEMAPLEELVNAQHAGLLSLRLRVSEYDPTLQFAPEPSAQRDERGRRKLCSERRVPEFNTKSLEFEPTLSDVMHKLDACGRN
jgi:hypothetical protein